MSKIHMKSAINRDTIPGLVKTLCGMHIKNTREIANNPSGVDEVTCKNCLKIYKEWQDGNDENN